jgi:sirohydrochlorin cobaltochelatase
MSASTAIVLLAHGARDPEWARPMERLAEAVSRQLPDARVTSAFLEFMAPTLGEAIDAAVAAGGARIRVVPVFLAAGGHVKRDVPAMIEAARQRHPSCTIEMGAVLGESEAVIAAMAGAAAAGL